MASHSNSTNLLPQLRTEYILLTTNSQRIIHDFNADNFKYRFKQCITPRVREVLIAIFMECDPQFTNSFIAIQKKIQFCYPVVYFMLRNMQDGSEYWPLWHTCN